VGFADGTFAVCDSDQLETTLLAREHSGRISRVAFHPEGDLAVTVSLDRTAVLWDLNRKAPLATLRAHGEAVRHAVFSPDGTRLVTGSSDGVARLWKIRWKR
jgi:WD40 repeat protein